MRGGEILPGTGRWRAQRDGGGGPRTVDLPPAPSTTGSAGGPPPRAGEDFGGVASRLAGLAGVAFGWTPDVFWRATPAELATLVRAAAGERGNAVDRDRLARLMEAFPDG